MTPLEILLCVFGFMVLVGLLSIPKKPKKKPAKAKPKPKGPKMIKIEDVEAVIKAMGKGEK